MNEWVIISHLNENSTGIDKHLYDYFIEADKAKQVSKIAGSGGIVSFRRNTRASVRGLWTNVLTLQQAIRTFRLAIEQAIEMAWLEGAAECGIQEDELTVAELTARDEFIFEQNELAPNFLRVVKEQSKANGGKLQPLLQRNEMWINQYSSAKQQSEAMACADEKRIWILGIVEEHCKTCPRLEGQVRRLSFWQNNVLPRNAPNEKLECGGYNCQCELRKTNKPLSRGRLPKLV
jgi:hypothetical protein